MIKGDFPWCRDIAEGHVCSKHRDMGLIAAWHEEEGWVIRCGAGHYPDNLQRSESLTQHYKRGGRLPMTIEGSVERRLGVEEPSGGQGELEDSGTWEGHREAMEEKVGKGKRLPAIYEATTGAVVQAHLQRAAVEYAESVGLQPRLGHICLYHGKPWVTIDGWYYRFRRLYPQGDVVSRPLGLNERSSRGIQDENMHAWQADVYDKAHGFHLAVGYGYAREGDEPLAHKSAVEPRWPWRLAEKRAEEDALRKAVPLDIGD